MRKIPSKIPQRSNHHPQDNIFPVGITEDRKECHRLPSLVNGKRIFPRSHYEHQAWMEGQTKA